MSAVFLPAGARLDGPAGQLTPARGPAWAGRPRTQGYTPTPAHDDRTVMRVPSPVRVWGYLGTEDCP
jgi:hypothetical protein